MKIATIDRFTPALDEIAGHSPNATFYHTRTWLQGLDAAFPGLEFRCLVAGGGDPAGILPFFIGESTVGRTMWSLPFGTYGGAIAGGDVAVADALVGAFAAAGDEAGVLETGIVDFDNRIESAAFRIEAAHTHILDLSPGFEAVWERFDRSKRRQNRKAKREGIVVAEAAGTADVSRYYRIYADRSDEWQQRIRYPESLFQYLLEGEGGHVKLFLATQDGNLLGGHLNFYFGDSVIAWNGVTLPGNSGHQASTALYTACIRHACEHGYTRYNLGASLGKSSLEAYKEAIGGVRYTYRVLRRRSLKGKVVAAVKRRFGGR